MKRFFFLAVLVFMAFGGSFAEAHERRVFEIGGKQYLFVVGSLNEPVFVDDKTGVDLRVKLADPANPGDSASPNAKPVLNLGETLKVEISAGEKKKEFALEPAYNDPGAYKAPFYPTVATTYIYRVFGTIEDNPVDLSFSCNPAGHPASTEDKTVVEMGGGIKQTLKVGSFGCPRAPADVQFPEVVGTTADLDQVSSSALHKGWSGIVIGAIALVLSLAAILRRGRTGASL